MTKYTASQEGILMSNTRRILSNHFQLVTYTIIVILLISLSSFCSDIEFYDFEDGTCPDFNGNYQLLKVENNNCVKIGGLSSENQIKLVLDTDASISFRWSHNLDNNNGYFYFLAPGIQNPIKCCSMKGISVWESRSFEVSRGETKWLLTSFDDIGYLDDLKIKYKGCHVTDFNINPLDSELFNTKDVYIKLNYDGNDRYVNNAQLDLIIPPEINISNISTNGFFNNARTTRNNGNIVSFNQSDSVEKTSAEIFFTIEIPYNEKLFIEVDQLVVNNKAQLPLFFNCMWEINSYDHRIAANKIMVNRSDINDI